MNKTEYFWLQEDAYAEALLLAWERLRSRGDSEIGYPTVEALARRLFRFTLKWQLRLDEASKSGEIASNQDCDKLLKSSASAPLNKRGASVSRMCIGLRAKSVYLPRLPEPTALDRYSAVQLAAALRCSV